jgi:hypothetical protein
MHRANVITATLLTFAAALLAPVPAQAERNVDSTTTDHKLLAPVRAAVPPVIDGILDDKVWESAVQLDNFFVPNLNRLPTERTILWLAFDDTCIYWAGRMFDRQPGTMRMDQTRRNGNVLNDDYISIGFDVDNNHIGGGEYVFRMTPRGTQSEDFPDGANTKVEWRGDWRGAARIDSLGWTCEVAFPMRMFNRPGGPRIIGVSSARRHPRTQERILWPNNGAMWDRTKCGDWPIVLPPHHERPRFMPYAVGEATGSSMDSLSGYFGGDVKWMAPNGIKFTATGNPDFQNVENEILGLDFSYTELIKGDNRPFFAEDIAFLPDSSLFYSNRVGKIYAGLKAVGEMGQGHRIGLIETYDRDEVNHLAGRWYWQPRDRFEINNSFAWRHAPLGTATRKHTPRAQDNVVAATNIKAAHIVRDGTETYQVQGAVTHTSDAVGEGYDVQASYERKPANADFGWLIKGRLVSADFLTIDGGLDTLEANQRVVSGRFGYERQYDRRLFKDWKVYVSSNYATRFDNTLYQRSVGLSTNLTLYPGIVLTNGIEDRNRPPYHDQTVNGTFGWMQDRLFTAGEIGSVYGKVKDADYFLVYVRQGFRPIRAITGNLGVQYRRRDFPVGHAEDATGGIEHLRQLVGTMQYDLSSERALSGRIVYTNDGVNGYAAFQQVLRRGMDLFLIVGDPSADTWTKRVALKAVFVL